MRFFWPVYLLSAAVGTAGVYLYAPLARPYVSSLLGLKPPAPRAAAAPQAVSPRAPDVAAEAGRGPAENAANASGPAEVPATSGEELSPALKGVYLAQLGGKPGWGVTRQRTNYYTLEGTRAGYVEGGVRLDYRRPHTSSKGGMVECVLYERGTPSAPLLVGVKDVVLFTGAYTNLSARQISDLEAYYTLSGKIINRRNELLQVSAAKNPHFETYQTSHKALMAHIEQAKTLALQRSRATEAEKTRIEDQLREMKIAENRLRADYDAAQLKFTTWKKEHAGELLKPEDDPFVKQWSKQMTDLSSGLPGLAY